MGKNSNYNVKRPRDYWPTVDPDAISPLVPFVRGKTYAEPCYGAGDLEDLLMEATICKWRSDLEPQVNSAMQKDALTLTKEDLHECALVITNPPYHWSMLKPLLDHLPTLKPTWFLLPADFMHNKRSGPYMKKCSHALSVGRLYWVDKVKGKDNYAWFQFRDEEFTCKFYGR